MKPNEPKSMHCDWAMMREETRWDKTDGLPELRGRLDKIREGFEATTEAPITHDRKLAELRYASAQLRTSRETEFARIDEAIATHRAAEATKPSAYNPIKFAVCFPGEKAAGLHAFTDTVTLAVESENPGGDPGEFEAYIQKALSDWYDGARVDQVPQKGSQ